MLKKFLLIISVLVLCAGCSKESPPQGKLRICVLDGMLDTPVVSAKITVPETGESFYTGENGMTPFIPLPVIKDPEYEKLLPSEEGRLTVIVRAEGYTPYLLLYARIAPGCERTIDVLLFEDDGTLPVFTVIEAPPAAWSEELVNQYD
jgi:hypothetical protein